ncbi:MAG TPA: mucoidy inhibitor MuiA family protein [Micavibrio sp.]|nr:mucoidy inhibitor MuiA family protein [Micavibrio sp.]
MRLLTALTLALITVSPASLMAAEIEAGSTLTAATVYANRATLTRRAVIDIPAGEHTVIFKNMTPSMMTDSLRAEGEANGNIIMGALTHKMETSIDLVAPREKELNDQILKLMDQIKVLEAEKAAISTKQDFINSLGEQAVMRENESIAEMQLNPESWAAAANTIHSQTSENLKATLALDNQIRDLNEQIQKLRTDMNQLRTGNKTTYTVSLPIEADRASKLTVDLSYQIPNATWQPLYDARLNTETEELELIQYGAVRQNTGEDWSDVKLTLSTAQPQRGATLPPLNAMWVSLRDNKLRQSRSFAKMARNEMLSAAPQAASLAEADYELADDGMALNEEIVMQSAEIKTGGFVSEYIIPGPSTVKADGSESKLKIGTFETENTLQVQVKPQLNDKAYLVSRAKLKGEAPILPGQVNLFRDGAFVGKMSIPLLRPDEEQDIGFGIDDQVSVKHSVMKDERSSAGVIVKDTEIERHYVTEIKNLHSQPINLVVLQTVPVTTDEEIKVEILPKQTLEGYDNDFEDVKGLLRWNFQMEPKSDKRVGLGWKASWPKDKNINGL